MVHLVGYPCAVVGWRQLGGRGATTRCRASPEPLANSRHRPPSFGVASAPDRRQPLNAAPSRSLLPLRTRPSRPSAGATRRQRAGAQAAVDRLLSPLLPRLPSRHPLQTHELPRPPCRHDFPMVPSTPPPCRHAISMVSTTPPPCRHAISTVPTTPPPCRQASVMLSTTSPPCRQTFPATCPSPRLWKIHE